VHEGARDLAGSLAGTAAFEQSRRERKCVEMLFAPLKRILKMGRIRLRGPKPTYCLRRARNPFAAADDLLREGGLGPTGFALGSSIAHVRTDGGGRARPSLARLKNAWAVPVMAVDRPPLEAM
jgi:hypothetical protein